VRAGLLRWPDSPGWRLTALALGLHAAFALPFGLLTGLYGWDPRIDLDLLRVALVALVVPALCEEAVFRGAIMPGRAEAPVAPVSALVALVAYLAWHPINATLFFPEVLPLFSDWRFLIVTGSLGVVCAWLWRATGSLWPPVLVHWAVVVAWKGLLGAPRML
jgi:uncharacterized protein